MRKGIAIIVRECAGFPRTSEAVRLGVPTPRGALFDCRRVVLENGAGDGIPAQARALASWPDGSVKWLLLDALVAVNANATAAFRLTHTESRASLDRHGLPAVVLRTEAGRMVVDTGAAMFGVPQNGSSLLDSVLVAGVDRIGAGGIRAELTTPTGAAIAASIETAVIEEDGPLRVTIRQDGLFAGRGGKIALGFAARITFVAGSASARIEFQIANRRAARHPGGLWDLGDPGSQWIKDLSLTISPPEAATGVRWYAEEPAGAQHGDPASLTIYQDSSGGERWDSPNHLDWKGRLSVAFRGYRVQGEGGRLVASGLRATPALQVISKGGWLALAVQDFWQNFPKALRWADGVVSVGLFPGESCSLFELQGGERKRHLAFFDFGRTDEACRIPTLQNPVQVWVDPAWVAETGVLPFLAQEEQEADPRYQHYVGTLVDGPYSFLAKREIVDEYGWRNFGDLYADHEAVHHREPGCFVSHYNNQYDIVFGAAIHYLRSANPRWHELIGDAARHTIDIDLYHTDEDRPAYANGYFWHTDHYRPAATCTHRTYSGRNGGKGYGGGPSNEHNYTSGLLLYHYLSGDPEAASAVRALADWVLAMDDGSRTLLGLVDDAPTGAATQTRELGYHKPGRGAGNSINALVDAYVLTGERGYLDKAEEFVRRCIHPQDDIDALALDEPESRWSYLVFLQVLGKYLALKAELGEHDYPYCYAQDSLIHYAKWMQRCEVPYKDVLHMVEIPTETWPAHDIRKSCVFDLASHFGPPELAAAFGERAGFFFDRCLTDVLSFETAYLTRPQVIICVNGALRDHFASSPGTGAGHVRHGYRFGHPEVFVPQRLRWKATASRKGGMLLSEVRRAISGAASRFLPRGPRS